MYSTEVWRVEVFVVFPLTSNFMVDSTEHTHDAWDGRTDGDRRSRKSINDLLTTQFYERRLVRDFSSQSRKDPHRSGRSSSICADCCVHMHDLAGE